MCLLLSATDANEEEMSFGSLCGGGRYDDLVASFDPKGQFKVFKDVCCLTGMITSHVWNMCSILHMLVVWSVHGCTWMHIHANILSHLRAHTIYIYYVHIFLCTYTQAYYHTFARLILYYCGGYCM